MSAFAIPNLIGAFAGGLFGAGIGGVSCFIICALLALISFVTGSPIPQAIGFSPFLTPSTCFIGAAVAASYANYKGYGNGANGAGDVLINLKKIDVLIVAGIGGLLGWVLTALLNKIGLAGLDTIACAVIIIPMITKIVWHKQFLTPVPEEEKALGGRFSPLVAGWNPGSRDAVERTLWASCYGAVLALAYFVAVEANVDASLAGLLGFGFGGFVLVFPGFPAQHFIGCVVCTALGWVNAQVGHDAIMFIVYGICLAPMAAHFAELCDDLFFRHTPTHIDIPAFSIACSTIILGLINLIAPTLFAGYVLPIVIFVVCVVVAVAMKSKGKKLAAQKGIAL